MAQESGWIPIDVHGKAGPRRPIGGAWLKIFPQQQAAPGSEVSPVPDLFIGPETPADLPFAVGVVLGVPPVLESVLDIHFETYVAIGIPDNNTIGRDVRRTDQ